MPRDAVFVAIEPDVALAVVGHDDLTSRAG
jgi:hypothetical protein